MGTFSPGFSSMNSREEVCHVICRGRECPVHAGAGGGVQYHGGGFGELDA